MPVSNAGSPLDNKLLASLPRDHFDRLLPHLTTVQLPQAQVLYEAGDEVDQVYFPHHGMLSLLAVLRDGKAIETATVGREGVVGAMAGLGPNANSASAKSASVSNPAARAAVLLERFCKDLVAPVTELS